MADSNISIYTTPREYKFNTRFPSPTVEECHWKNILNLDTSAESLALADPQLFLLLLLLLLMTSFSQQSPLTPPSPF